MLAETIKGKVMSIKNWVIKKLGGYTADEWDVLSDRCDEEGSIYISPSARKDLQRRKNISLRSFMDQIARPTHDIQN